MRSTLLIPTLLSLLVHAAPRPAINALPPGPPHTYKANKERAEAVKAAFKNAWMGYNTVFGFDEIRPISGKGGNSRNGWGATPIDALTTAILMDEKAVVNQVLDFVPKINFMEAASRMESVSLFETTIRYLGGLVSAYDLLGPGGPKASLVEKGKVRTQIADALALN